MPQHSTALLGACLPETGRIKFLSGARQSALSYLDRALLAKAELHYWV